MPYASRRVAMLAAAEEKLWDVAVVGGGITGAGVARDATLAGLSVILLEQGDFGSGTSSRSTKIFHGGLRYLEHLELGLVRVGGRERERMAAIGAHLVERMPMMLPVYAGNRYGLSALSGAVWLYDVLAGVGAAERRRVLSRAETVQAAPGLRQDGLMGAVAYHEFVTDDARTTLAVLRSAVERGAVAVNYARVEALRYQGQQVAGVVAADREAGGTRRYQIQARQVVNAAGPWVESVMALEPGVPAGRRLLHSRGIHVVVSRPRLPVTEAWSLPSPDSRLVFVIPHGDSTYIGTTDVPYTGALEAPPVPAGEVQYLLDVVNAYFPLARLQPDDVSGAWSGVRPLIREPGRRSQDVSRRDQIWVSASGLVTIAGGKLTAWRQMAEEVMRVLYREASRYGRRFPVEFSRYQARSRATPLVGHPGPAESWRADLAGRLREGGLAPEDAWMMAGRYGAEATNVLAAGGGDLPPERVTDGVPLLSLELPYLMDTEMGVHLADVVVRRTGLGWFGGRAARAALPRLAGAVGAVMGWDADQVEVEMARTVQEAYWTVP
jgi:glycerol-3-phosphate dehydrogenase